MCFFSHLFYFLIAARFFDSFFSSLARYLHIVIHIMHLASTIPTCFVGAIRESLIFNFCLNLLCESSINKIGDRCCFSFQFIFCCCCCCRFLNHEFFVSFKASSCIRSQQSYCRQSLYVKNANETSRLAGVSITLLHSAINSSSAAPLRFSLWQPFHQSFTDGTQSMECSKNQQRHSARCLGSHNHTNGIQYFDLGALRCICDHIVCTNASSVNHKHSKIYCDRRRNTQTHIGNSIRVGFIIR